MAKMDKGVLTGKPVTYPIPSPAGGVQMETFIPTGQTRHQARNHHTTGCAASVYGGGRSRAHQA